MFSSKQHRRGFLGSMAGLLALAPGSPLQAQGNASPHDAWLEGLNGKHRQFFDVGHIDEGAPLRRVHNFLATYASAYGLEERDVNAVFGAHGAAVAFLLDDAAWMRFGLGRLYGVNDASTGSPASRNPFVHARAPMSLHPDSGVARLQERGVRFLMCRNTLTALASHLTGSGDAEAVLGELTRRRLPGVIVVPAMLIAGNRAQEAGLTYAALG